MLVSQQGAGLLEGHPVLFEIGNADIHQSFCPRPSVCPDSECGPPLMLPVPAGKPGGPPWAFSLKVLAGTPFVGFCNDRGCVDSGVLLPEQPLESWDYLSVPWAGHHRDKTCKDPSPPWGSFGSGPLHRSPSSIFRHGQADAPSGAEGWAVPRRLRCGCWLVPVGGMGRAKQRHIPIGQAGPRGEEMLPWGLYLLPRNRN